jgi:Spy/CpxP family protein refolding chaperone
MTTPANPSSGSPRRGRAVAVLVLLLVALAGGLAGVALDRLVLLPRHPGGLVPRPPFGGGQLAQEREREFRDHMARTLGLSDSQRVRIDSLLEHQLQELRAIRQEVRPRLDSIIARTRRQIDSILTPEQREKARAMLPRGGPRGARPAGRGPQGGLGPPPPGEDWGPAPPP